MKGKEKFFLTIVYGFNKEEDRLSLWNDLISFGIEEPWILLGDFNAILYKEDRIGRKAKGPILDGFWRCVQACGFEDVKYSGCRYTWTNKQEGDDRIYSKIDRVLAN